MLRITTLLLALVMVPVQGRGQAVATLFERDDSRDVASVVNALERSRDALLEAREAVDTALIEVDHALGMVRSAAIARFSPGTRPPSLWSAPGTIPRLHLRRWLETAAAAVAGARTALNAQLATVKPRIEGLRLAAFRALEAHETAPARAPAPSTPRDDGGAPPAVLPTAARGRQALASTVIPQPSAPQPSSAVGDALAAGEAEAPGAVMPEAPLVAEPFLPTIGSP